MKKIALVLAMLVSMFGLPIQPVHAAVPHLLTYQGILKDSSGNFLTGTYSMVFKLYTASSGGTAAWTETQSTVSVSSGRFSVQLGSVTTLSLDFSADYWLGIAVGTDSEMTPRVRLTSVGYAMRAEEVVNGFTQNQHDALSHKNIVGVRENSTNIAKTNFKMDAYTSAAANDLGSLVVDTFNDASGINSGSSSGYQYRGTPNYDVVATSGGGDSNAVLLLHMNGTDASTTFTDSGGGTNNPYTVTANGNAQIDTAQSKFGSASGLFDGTGDYTLTSGTDFNFGTSSFTWDFWLRFNTLTDGHSYCLFSNQYYTAGKNGNFTLGIDANSGATDTLNLYTYDSNNGATVERAYAANLNFTSGTWYHIAVTRSGNTIQFYLDGTALTMGASTVTKSIGATTPEIKIGKDGVSDDLNGWIDEFRISKGVVRWTSNFTPPSQEYSTPQNATVVSTTFTKASVPTDALVTASETLNGHAITYYVSRDNGTTWTQCTNGTVTSIASQPSGTQLRWKASIEPGAELDAIAVGN